MKFNAEGQEEINFYNQKFSNPNYDINRKGRNATHQFTQFLGVKGYPTMVFLSENGAPIMPVVGYQKPMNEDRSEDFQKHFAVTHFFNPPRYLKLLEVIPTPETSIQKLLIS